MVDRARASLPLLVVLLGWATGASQHAAINAAVWVAVAGVVAFELAAGVRSRAGPVEIALDVGFGAALGVGILALKAVLG